TDMKFIKILNSNLLKKRVILKWCVVILGYTPLCNAQYSLSSDSLQHYPLQIDLPLLDLPFQGDASRTGELFDSYSMQQALAVTQNLHRINYHFNNKLWHGIIRPDTKRKQIYNRIAANVTSGLVDYVFTYYGVVLSPQWMHEEFHRAGLTI